MSRPSVHVFDRALLVGNGEHPRTIERFARLQAVASLRFAFPRATHATVSVADPTGRVVRTLFQGELEPGEHVALWDGLDEHGGPVAAGGYSLRLETDGGILTSRLVTLR